MATITAKVEGIADLSKRIELLTTKVRKKVLGSAVGAGALVTLKAVKAKAPVKTGELRSAVKQRRSRKFSKLDYEERHVGVFKVKGGKYAKTKHNVRKGRVGKEYQSDPPEYYWKFLEFGTVKMSPKPFIRPGFEASKQQAVSAIVTRLRKKLDEVTRELPK